MFPDEVDAERFDQLCSWVANWFNVLPLDLAVARLQNGTLPTCAMSITFDDGYADNCTIAAPILQRHGLTATFFVATGYLNGGRMWNDTVIEAVRRSGLDRLDLRDLHPQLDVYPLADLGARGLVAGQLLRVAKYLPVDQRTQLVDSIAARAAVELPNDLMMTVDQVRQLAALGMQVGAHTVTHPILRLLSRQAALQEMVGSRDALEAILGRAVKLFAYPNGKPGEDYSPESVDLAREAGFAAAVSTQWGVSSSSTDLFQLRRFTPWDRHRLKFGARLLRNLVQRS